MRMPLDFSIAETVVLGVRAKFALVPDGKFHRQRGKLRRLASAPTQAGADAEGAAVVRGAKGLSGVVVPVVGRVMGDAAHNAVEGNHPAGIQKLVDARGNFAAVAPASFRAQI